MLVHGLVFPKRMCYKKVTYMQFVVDFNLNHNNEPNFLIIADRVAIGYFPWTWPYSWFWTGTQLWQVSLISYLISIACNSILGLFLCLTIWCSLQTLWFAWIKRVWEIYTSHCNRMSRASNSWAHGYISPHQGNWSFWHVFTWGCHKLWWGEITIGERSWSLGSTGLLK